MELTNSILEDVREALGIGKDVADFDTEILMHINTALSVLNQNGIGNSIMINDTNTTWLDFQDPLAIEGNKVFAMVPLFITLSTKQIFDPPPPSTVEYYTKNIDSILWRLKIAYENLPVVKSTILVDDY